jgi:hypothetical protein
LAYLRYVQRPQFLKPKQLFFSVFFGLYRTNLSRGSQSGVSPISPLPPHSKFVFSFITPRL